jgi:malate dehydrogenase
MKITVIGAAGCVGSATAFNIAMQGMADELVMIGGKRQNVLMHHAMDIGAAAASLKTEVSAGSYKDMSGSDIVINAAGIHQDISSPLIKERLPLNLPMIKEVAQNINQFCPDAMVITATNPVDPLNYAMYLLSKGRDRNKIIGFSLNDSTRYRVLAGRVLGVKSNRIEITAIGEHGPSKVLLFSSLRVDGKPIVIDEKAKQKIRESEDELLFLFEGLKAGRTTGWTSAWGITALCRAIINNTGETIPCCVALDGEYGCKNMCMGVPVVLGRGGLRKVLEWKLAPEEKEALAHSVDILKPGMRYVEEHL